MSRSRSRPPVAPAPRGPVAVRSWRWRQVAAAAGLVIATGLLWWFRGDARVPSRPVARPNVLLVTLDTTRADRLGSYGYGPASTPHLDRLAREGVRFERALSPVPLTLPAHASLLTGRQPYSHGVRNNGHFQLPDDVSTLAALLTSRGYQTAAFVSTFVLGRQFGLARGFVHYDDGLDEGASGQVLAPELERRGDRTLAAAQAWLGDASRRGGAPYFAWVHLYDPHEPYAPPSPFRERFAGRPYDGELAFTDSLVGTLLEASGYGGPGSPLVIVVGDHGESLGEHGEQSHGVFVYGATLRVPLIVAWPGVLRPRVVPTTVRLIDVAPSIAALTGAGPLDAAEGQSLRPLLEGHSGGAEPVPAYGESYFPQFFMRWAPLRTVEAGRWKYIDAPEPELYDLQTDPAEQRNMVASETARAASLKRTLAGMVGAGTGRQAAIPVTDDTRRRLDSLGYLSTSAPATTPPSERLPDPKRMMPLYERLLEGNRLLSEGRAEEAARLSQQVLVEDRSNAFAHVLLGRAALALGRNAQAIAAFTAYVTLVPGSADAHHWMALAHLRLGHRSRALAEEEAALAIDPRMVPALALKAGLLFSSGRRDDGLRVLQDAVARDGTQLAVRLELADLLTDAGRYAEAEAEYRRLIAARARDVRALLGLGLVLGATGRVEEAIVPLDRAVDADPRSDEARFARAEVLEQLGRTEEAGAEYARVASDSMRDDLRRIAQRKAASLQPLRQRPRRR